MNALIESQDGLSNSAQLNLHFDLTGSRPALISRMSGSQAYPASRCVRRSPVRLETQLKVRVPYSLFVLVRLLSQGVIRSICAAIRGKGLLEEMGAWLASKQASIATAHAQRSFADITLDLSDNEIPDFIGIIDLIENALGTPLQTAVKREDEQAFAKRNAENLMFVEDSVRRLHEALSTYYQATYFRVKVEHQESLHAHDAIAELSGPVHR